MRSAFSTWPRCSNAAAYARGLDRPLDEQDPAVVEAKRFGVKTIDEVLAYAMRTAIRRRPPRQRGCWARSARRPKCCSKATGRRRLALALQDPDRRLRMAALEADRAIAAFRAVCRFELRAVGTEFLRRPAAARGARWSPARTSMRPAAWRACWRRPVTRPTRSRRARNCFGWPLVARLRVGADRRDDRAIR